MSNKPNFRAPVSLAEFVDRRREEGSITVELPDGDPILIPPAELWPASVMQASGRRRMTLEQRWRGVVGDEAFDRFAAAATSVAGDANPAVLLDKILETATLEKQGATPGE